MIRVLLILLLFASCKKDDINPEPVKVAKLFSAKTISAAYFEVSLNGNKAIPPFNVFAGDVVYVDCKAQVSTPEQYNMSVYFYVDGVLVGSCVRCNSYDKKFVIQ